MSEQSERMNTSLHRQVKILKLTSAELTLLIFCVLLRQDMTYFRLGLSNQCSASHVIPHLS
jgi:hypothetical protein